MKNKILIIACLVLVLCVSLVLPMTTAFADYTDDVLNNPQAIVNFNQLVNNEFISGYSFPQYSTSITDNGIISGHTYFIKDSCDSNLSREYYGGPVGSGFSFTIVAFNTSGVNSSLYTATQSADRIRIYCNATTYVNSLMIIDLTQMFGSNLPNLQQCNDLFVAGYYAYNTGSAISLSGINAYQQGYDAALGGFEVIESSDMLYASVFSYETTHFSILNNDRLVYFSGIIGLPLGITCVPNDVISIDFGHILIASDTTFEVGYIYNNVFIPIDSYTNSDFTLGTLSRHGSITFTIPVTTSTLYFRCMPGSTYPEQYCHVGDFTMTIRTINAYAETKAAWDNGYKKAKDYYLALYSQGGSGYQAIYNKGYYDYPNDEHFDFRSLITSAVDVPVQAMTNLFDFDILGVNMKTFYLSVFTLCVIFVVLRLVL